MLLLAVGGEDFFREGAASGFLQEFLLGGGQKW